MLCGNGPGAWMDPALSREPPCLRGSQLPRLLQSLLAGLRGDGEGFLLSRFKLKPHWVELPAAGGSQTAHRFSV